MKLALQPVRRNLRAKPAPANLSTCAQFASIDSAIVTFRTLSKNCRVASARLSKFFRHRSSDAKRHANKPFRMNTCKSVSKQRTLTAFRINTCEKRGEGGNPTPAPSFRRRMRHVAPLSPVASVDCAYFLSPRGCTHYAPQISPRLWQNPIRLAPLFSYSYKSLLPGPFSFRIHAQNPARGGTSKSDAQRGRR
jgi:hypothetical protein